METNDFTNATCKVCFTPAGYLTKFSYGAVIRPLNLPVVNVISFSPLDQRLVRFSPLDHVKEITCHLFKTVQFDFEEGNFESGLGIKLLLLLAIAM